MKRSTDGLSILLRGTFVMAILASAACAADPEGPASEARPREAGLAPVAMVPAANSHRLFVACATARAVLVLDRDTGKWVQRIELPDAPSGLALSADGSRLFVTCGAAESRICSIDIARGTVASCLPAGHATRSPVLAPDGKRLYVCDRFDDCVTVHELSQKSEPVHIAVPRQPIALALTTDGKTLLIAHHLPDGRADQGPVSAGVSVVDLATRKVAAHLALPAGSGLLREINIAPDGRIAAVSHNLAHFKVPTTQVDRGWMNTGALTLIDIPARAVINTVLLDEVDRGAANPWAIAWTADSQILAVSHAGTHDLSVIDVPALLARLRSLTVKPAPSRHESFQAASRVAADVPSDLAFLVGIRRRVPLAGNGPRSLAIAGSQLFAAGYFSDTVERVDLRDGPLEPVTMAQGPPQTASPIRRGEMLFNDATLSFQGWQSCASCHSDDARVDGLNWDLLNDGIGNPRNTKSLLWAHRTPPAMSSGVRETAETAVRAGLSHILFTVQSEDVPAALDAYLRSLQPLPSPTRVHGALSPAARRGEALFRSPETGCAGCHSGGLRTDMHAHDVGTAGPFDQGRTLFDTPALVELWRTAPFLHDGSCVSLQELLTSRNSADRHGRTSHLSKPQIDDLVAYLLSL